MVETVIHVQPDHGPKPGTTTTTTTTTTTGGGLSWLTINTVYYRTTPGIIKLVMLLVGILCMSLASPARLDSTHFFLFVATISFIGTLIWVFVYLLGIREALTLPIDWLFTEMVNMGICAILYTIAFICQLTAWSDVYGWGKGSNIAAGVFGIINALLYGYATFLLYVDWKNRT